MPQETIGIIAGSGQFPNLVAEGARSRNLDVAICGFHGHTDPSLENTANVFTLVHLGQFSKLIRFFKKHHVRRICFAGAINKPKALQIRPDWRAARILMRMRNKGDDALLRAAAEEFASEGLLVVQPAEFAPGLLAPEGVLSTREPTGDEWMDIRFGWPIARSMGRFDIGQCLVVRQGMVMAVECLEGTDATLARGAQLGGPGCMAIKVVKPGQDERMDLPSIGTTTMEILIANKFSGLALQASKTLFFDREKALAMADAAKLCIVALPEDFMQNETESDD
jgi:DUF1009 family protein